MRICSISAIFAAALLCLYGVVGCAQRGSDAPAAGETADAHEHEHEHGDEGPHGGHIIELGTEDHHAELMHDEEAHRVGVYFLGSAAKTAKPIAAESVTINISVDGQPSQYTLPAAPQEGETAGSSSYFEIVSEPLCAVVCGESESPHTHARLSVTIEGKPYVGLIETEAHEHEPGHEHAH